MVNKLAAYDCRSMHTAAGVGTHMLHRNDNMQKYSKCGQNGHAGKMAPSVNILALRMILKSYYTKMTAVH